MQSLKTFAKNTLPAPLVGWMLGIRNARRQKILAKASNRAEIFSAIYSEGMWGGADRDFYSGHGSHEPAVVNPYVEAVRKVLEDLPGEPTVVDLGCGDFGVGSKIRPHAGRYIAGDIVPELIARNQQRFPDTEFVVLDIVTDDLPQGDVVTVREVLQHLSNADISGALPKLAKFKRVIITEGVPTGDFVPNHDKAAGFDIRFKNGSGVDIAAAPFNFPVKSQQVICEVLAGNCLLRTTLYEPA